ncbi:membrane dipeptidase [Haliangium sp.]|uniref:membrane dipeptidase n=1 Tax=Haliangium sp. TaxID=2663208 RepID=UPI003D0C5301
MKSRSLIHILTAALLTAGVLLAPRLAHAAGCGDTVVIYNLFDMTMDELFENGEGQLGPRRLVTNQESNIVSFTTRRFIQTTASDIDRLEIVIRKIGHGGIGGKTTFAICRTDANDVVTKLDEFSISGGNKTVGDVVRRTYQGLRDKRLSIRLVGNSPFGSARFTVDVRRPGGEGQVWQPTQSTHSAPVSGFADLHVHQAADLAYSGGWYWGSHREGDEAALLGPCTGDNHATLQFLGHDLGVEYIDSHPDMTRGFPDFAEWPHWNDIKHQQVALSWLRDAHENGLNLAVISVVNNQWLSAAAIMSGRHDNRLSPSDMESVRRQIRSLHRLDEATDWYTIVRDPWEARRAIERGELAVVLAVEASDILPPSDGPWLEQLHDLYHMGVRTVQLAHESNSHFAGAAYHRDVFQINSMIKSWFDADIDYASDGDGVHNPLGLTNDGEALLREMIRLGMLIDITHLSLETQRDIYDIVSAEYDYYPLYNSHTRMDAVLTPEGHDVLKEFVTTDETLSYVRITGGVLGLRTGEDPMLDHGVPRYGSYVANNCDGSSRSFAQFYQYADDRGVNLAFGSDFNGFITQMVPRFGPDACANAPDAATRQDQVAAQGQPNPNVTPQHQEFRTKGLAHIGLLPAVIDDMDELGVDTTNIRHSAEAFVGMWERVYDDQRGPID